MFLIGIELSLRVYDSLSDFVDIEVVCAYDVLNLPHIEQIFGDVVFSS